MELAPSLSAAAGLLSTGQISAQEYFTLVHQLERAHQLELAAASDDTIGGDDDTTPSDGGEAVELSAELSLPSLIAALATSRPNSVGETDFFLRCGQLASCVTSRAAADALVDGGIVPAMMQVVRERPLSLDEQTVGCRAFGSLAFASPDAAAALFAHDAVGALLDAMTNHLDDGLLICSVWAALGAVALTQATQPRGVASIVEKRGHIDLVHAIAQHAGDVAIETNGFWALSHIARLSDVAAEEIDRAGALVVGAAAMQRSPADRELADAVHELELRLPSRLVAAATLPPPPVPNTPVATAHVQTKAGADDESPLARRSSSDAALRATSEGAVASLQHKVGAQEEALLAMVRQLSVEEGRVDETQRAGAATAARLTEQLREREATAERLADEYETLHSIAGPTMQRERELNALRVDARAAAIDAAQMGAAVSLRTLGALDSSPSGPLAQAARAGRLNQLDAAELDTLYRDADWNPTRVDASDPLNLRVVFNVEDERIVSVRARFGPAVADDVRRAYLELDDHNPSGRYPVRKPWHVTENRELTPSEVIRTLARQVVALKRERANDAVRALIDVVSDDVVGRVGSES